MNFINRDLRAHASGFLLVLLFSAFCCPQAIGQGKLTYFEGEIDGMQYIGYSKGKWYFSSSENLFIYDKSMKLQTKSKFKLPKGWEKANVMNRRMVNGMPICLATQADNKKGIREFASFKISDDGVLEPASADEKNRFNVDEKEKRETYMQLIINRMERGREASFCWHMFWAFSPDTNWMVIEHEQKIKDSDKKEKRIMSYFVLDRNYQLANSFTHTIYEGYWGANISIDNSGTVFHVQNIDTVISSKRTESNKVQIHHCTLDKKQFKLEEINFGSTDVPHARMFHFDGRESRLVCLGRSEEDIPEGIDRLLVYRRDTQKEGFVKEHDVYIWKLKGMGKPPGAYEKEADKRDFRLLDCFIIADNRLIVLFDDYGRLQSIHDNQKRIAPPTSSTTYTTLTHSFADYVYAANLGPNGMALDYFTSHRYLLDFIDDYMIVQKQGTGELYFYINDDPGRHGQEAEKPNKLTYMNLYSPGTKDLLARFIYTPGKGFKNEIVLSPEEAKKRKLVTVKSVYNLGGGKYLSFIKQGKLSKTHFPVIIEI